MQKDASICSNQSNFYHVTYWCLVSCWTLTWIDQSVWMVTTIHVYFICFSSFFFIYIDISLLPIVKIVSCQCYYCLHTENCCFSLPVNIKIHILFSFILHVFSLKQKKFKQEILIDQDPCDSCFVQYKTKVWLPNKNIK